MASQVKADILLSSNAVFTGTADTPSAASIAIVGNKIVAIGSPEDMEAWVGEHTKVYAYDDQLILPGFHDFHLHIMMGSLSHSSLNLFSARTKKEALEMIRSYADARPDEPWIIGFKWDSDRWEDDRQMPNRLDLDSVVADRPVFLLSLDYHYAWVNSKALAVCQVDKHTENPPFGEIGKDDAGELTGILYERATGLVSEAAFQLSHEQAKRLFENFQQLAARMGVTAVNDMYGGSLPSDQYYRLYKEFEDHGELTTRVHIYPPLCDDIEQAKEYREQYASDKLRVGGLKQFIDGVVSSSTAYLVEPYSDQPETKGIIGFPVETYTKWVVEADKAGFSIRFHAIGDGAVRLALDSYEAARKENGPRDSRHSVEHVEVIEPSDIPRFKELGVIASMQPGLMANTGRVLYTERIGEERAKRAFAVRTLQEAGAPLAFGTDFPIDGLNPLYQIHRAVTRMDSTGRVAWNPEQSISLSDALKAYTSGSAYGTFREHELGTLEVGKLADIIVLDRNLFASPGEELLEARVKLTLMDGQIVFTEEAKVEESSPGDEKSAARVDARMEATT